MICFSDMLIDIQINNKLLNNYLRPYHFISVIQLTYQSCTLQCPVFSFLSLRVQMDTQNEVCWLTCSWKYTRTLARLVTRAVILALCYFIVLDRKEKDGRCRLIEFSDFLVQKWVSACIIAGSLEEKSINISSLLGLNEFFSLDFGHFELKRKSIYRDFVSTGVCLQKGSE